MLWSNEVVLEFLSLYKATPSLWDPKDLNYNNRNEVLEGWQNICDSLSIESSIAELKRKKESLMASYRWHKKKMSKNPGYQPSWYAFDFMDSFLASGRFPDCPKLEIPGIQYYTDVNADDLCDPIGLEDNSGEEQDVKNIFTSSKPRRFVKSSNGSRKIKQQANYFTKKRERDLDDCEMYGKLLVSKLRKLDERQRDLAMHEIDNIMFQAKMKTLHVLSADQTSDIVDD